MRVTFRCVRIIIKLVQVQILPFGTVLIITGIVYGICILYGIKYRLPVFIHGLNFITQFVPGHSGLLLITVGVYPVKQEITLLSHCRSTAFGTQVIRQLGIRIYRIGNLQCIVQQLPSCIPQNNCHTVSRTCSLGINIGKLKFAVSRRIYSVCTFHFRYISGITPVAVQSSPVALRSRSPGTEIICGNCSHDKC